MHGAGMTHLLWLPTWGGVLECWPSPDHGWFVYSHMSQWSGLEYRVWENHNPSMHMKNDDGDVTTVNEVEFMTLAQNLIDKVREKKARVKTHDSE